MVQGTAWARGTEGHRMTTRKNLSCSSTADNSYIYTQTSAWQQARQCLLNKTQGCPRVTLYFLSDINQRCDWAVNCFQCLFIWISYTGTKPTLRHVLVKQVQHHAHTTCQSWRMLHHMLYSETLMTRFGPSKSPFLRKKNPAPTTPYSTTTHL